MSSKIGEVIITAFIVLMLGGMLAGGSDTTNNDVTVSDDFESTEIFETDGYTKVDPFAPEDNKLSKVNEKISVLISNLANDSLDFVFDLLKKMVS